MKPVQFDSKNIPLIMTLHEPGNSTLPDADMKILSECFAEHTSGPFKKSNGVIILDGHPGRFWLICFFHFTGPRAKECFIVPCFSSFGIMLSSVSGRRCMVVPCYLDLPDPTLL